MQNPVVRSEGLPVFLSTDGLPQTEAEIVAVLRSAFVSEVRHYVLGPGKISNIPQACQRWCDRTGLSSKSTMVCGRIPDEYLLTAQAVDEPGVVSLYWTCAVFGREKDLFFGLGMNTLMFFVQEVMPLDHMQLAILPGRLSQAELDLLANQCQLPPHIQTATSHASPKPLMASTGRLLDHNPHCAWIEADSNGAAAEMVRDGKADICITTEKARQEVGLQCLHDYGCPPMVFFGGLTQCGAAVVAAAYTAFKMDRQEKARDAAFAIETGDPSIILG